MAKKEAAEVDPRVAALLDLAAVGLTSVDLVRHDVLLGLIADAVPDVPATKRAGALLCVFQEVLDWARRNLPRDTPKPSTKNTPLNVMAACVMLGLTDARDVETLESRLSASELDVFSDQQTGRTALQARQLEAAYWEGNRNLETGRRNTGDYLRIFLAEVGRRLADDQVRSRI